MAILNIHFPITVNGIFCEYHEIMPFRQWHKEIAEWQAMNNPKNRNNQGSGQTQ